MPQECPRCSAQVDRFVCPACGLDLPLYAELRALRAELQRLMSPGTAPPPLPSREPLPLQGPGHPGQASSPAARSEAGRRHRVRALNEVAVGQRWFLALGVIAILFGAGFFLKYAFDERWIGPAVQITLAFIAGLCCLGGGQLLRHYRWKGMDGGLVALGLGLLYLSAYAGSQVYELLPDYLTLVLALIIAALGIAIASAWDSLFLAVLTFMGGYLAPLLLVAERFGHWLFFLYVAVLNAATQVLAYQRKWPLLYTCGALFSWICLGVWASNHDQRERFVETFTFTQFLFFLYSVAPFARSLLRADAEKPQGYWVSMLNGLLCVWNSAYLLDFRKLPVTLVTATYAVVAFGLALRFWRERRPGLATTWLVAEGMIVPPYSMVMGVPGKVKREITEAEKGRFRENAQNYVRYRQIYREEPS